tara:strand:- start:384 stop:2141 length:1758 start_codon:yes stop_codon:yes gene_type:complete
MILKLKILFSLKQRWLLFVLFILSLLTVFLEFLGISAVPIFVAILLEDNNLIFFDKFDISFLNNYEKRDLIFYSSIVLIFIYIIKNIYLLLFTYFQAYIQKNLRGELSKKIFNNYIFSNYNFFLKKNSSILIRNIGSEVSQTVTFIISFLSMFKELLILLMIFSLLLFADPIVSLSIFVLIFILVLVYYSLTKNIIVKNGKIIQGIRGDQLQHMTQSFNTIKEIKVFNKEDFINKLFSKQINIFEKSFLINSFLSSIPRILIESFLVLGIIGIIFFYISINKSFTDLIPLLSLLAVSAVRLIPSFSSISRSLSIMKNYSPSLNTIVDEIVNFENKNEVIDEPKSKEFSKTIKFNNVSFSYQDTKKNALTNLNFEINFGDKIGIIGGSGSGKSTLINLLIGLLKSSNGEILVDEININRIPKSWSNQISYVPQDIYLLDDSIKNNIAFGENQNQIDTHKINEVINLSQLKDVISNLEKKEETFVGDKAVRISGGQKQRIGIARSLYFNRKILVFDEATNAIDADNEKKIISNIVDTNKNKTIIYISHNHETIKNFDKIIYLDKGKIVDIGKYDNLNAKYNFSKISN